MKPDWIVYYDDGTKATSESDPWSIPRHGVEVIVRRDDRCGYIIQRTAGDYFVYDPDRNGWRITDIFGVYDHLGIVERPLVLFGREMADKRFADLLKQVEEDIGPKSGWLAYEQKPLD